MSNDHSKTDFSMRKFYLFDFFLPPSVEPIYIEYDDFQWKNETQNEFNNQYKIIGSEVFCYFLEASSQQH